MEGKNIWAPIYKYDARNCNGPQHRRDSCNHGIDHSSSHNKGCNHRHRLRSTKSFVNLPRLVRRDMPFHQSRNKLSVKNEQHYSKIWKLLLTDWFHVMLRLPTWFSVSMLLCTWTAVILMFAAIYVAIDTQNKEIDCGLGEPGFPIAWATSFAFSLETCTTVGYGLPGSTNAYFEANCPEVQVAIYAQMTWSMMFNAFLFAFFFASLSKCENRSVQMVFANKLCISIKDGSICVSSRCYDIDSSNPVVEAHARMYVMDRKMKMRVLRLHDPNDDMGGMLYASLPTEITHVVDHHSALSPRAMPLIMSSPGLVLRGADSHAGNREEIECPVCGETYGTYERLMKHLQYTRMVEERDGYQLENSHRGFRMPDISAISLEEVKSYIENSISEIVVVVEGIDPQVSGTFQSLQSYKYKDIVWEGEFEPCLSVKNNQFAVDLSLFHDIRVPGSPPCSDMDDESFAACNFQKNLDDDDEEAGIYKTFRSIESADSSECADNSKGTIELKMSTDTEETGSPSSKSDSSAACTGSPCNNNLSPPIVKKL